MFSFVQAKCDFITTATYQLSIENLMKNCELTHEQAEEIIFNSVKLARNVIGMNKYYFTKKINMILLFDVEKEKAQCHVAASIGPYGAVLSDGSEFNGWYTDSMSIQVHT